MPSEPISRVFYQVVIRNNKTAVLSHAWVGLAVFTVPEEDSCR